MASAEEFLKIVIDSAKRCKASDIARASIKEKDEGLFRDLALAKLSDSSSGLRVQREWSVPTEAFQRWQNLWPATKKRGRVDLVGFSVSDSNAQVPSFASEFKLWYWYDALNDTKYKGKPSRYNHYVSQSFVMDATKLMSVAPTGQGSRFIVTVVPTYHLDVIARAIGTSSVEAVVKYLEDRSVPYIPNLKQSLKLGIAPTPEVRSLALTKISSYFTNLGCPTVVGGDIVAELDGISVTTDFVVSEIPTTLRDV